MRNILFTGGWAHDFATHAPLLAAAVDGAVPELETEIVEDLDTMAERVAAGVDLVTVYACRFRMLDERYTADQRATWASETPEPMRRALTDHVESGRPLLAVHTAAVCFDDWPEWRDLLGGGWSWEHSWHPAPAQMTVRLLGDHPIVDGVTSDTVTSGAPGRAGESGDFAASGAPTRRGDRPSISSMPSISIVDERYTDLVVHETTRVLGVSADDDGVDQPVLWCHDTAGGRVVYDSLGHDVRSLTHPGHRELIARSVRWLLSGDA